MGFEDIADEGYKQRALDTMFTLIQSQAGYTMSDYIQIENLYTKTEIENYFQFRDLQIKRERIAAEKAAAEQAAIDAEENRNSQELQTAEREAAATQRQTDKLENDQILQDKKIVADMIMSQP